jgi:hypothetical protein
MLPRANRAALQPMRAIDADATVLAFFELVC